MQLPTKMAHYLLVTRDHPITGDIERIKANYPEIRQIAENALIIQAKGTSTEEISRKIFPRSGEEENKVGHVITRMGPFYGFHNRAIWEWMDKDDDGKDE